MPHLIGGVPMLNAKRFIVLLRSKCVFDETDGWDGRLKNEQHNMKKKKKTKWISKEKQF